MAKMDLLAKDWNDILFEGRNLSYGAYYMRGTTGQRFLKSLIAAFVLLAAIIALIFTAKAVNEAIEAYELAQQANEMTEIEVEQEEEQIVVEESKPDEGPMETVTEMASSIQFTAPVFVDVVEEDKALLNQKAAQDAKAKMGEFNFQGNDETSTNIKSDQKQLGAVASSGDGEGSTQVFSYVEQMPSFPGGDNALAQYINSHLKYPSVSLEEGVQGVVQLRFVVNENGSVGEVQILKSTVDSYCDKEAKRVVASLPRFTPGRQNGKAVKVWFTMPIRFHID